MSEVWVHAQPALQSTGEWETNQSIPIVADRSRSVALLASEVLDHLLQWIMVGLVGWFACIMWM